MAAPVPTYVRQYAIAPADLLAPDMLFRIPGKPVWRVLTVTRGNCGRLGVECLQPGGRTKILLIGPSVPVDLFVDADAELSN